MKKHTISILLVLSLLCMLLPKAAFASHAETVTGTCGAEGDGSNLIWSLDTADGTLKIEGSGIMKEYSWGASPWINYAEQIKYLKLPDQLTEIGQGAFSDLVLLTEVKIPDSVTRIGYVAFAKCTGLKSVNIPQNVVAIEGGAFYGCSALAELHLPDGIKYIGQEILMNTAFYNDPANWTDGLLYLDGWLVDAKWPDYGESVHIQDGTIGISDECFHGASGLKQLTLPSGLRFIGSTAFCGSGLESVVIPGTVNLIGSQAFAGCNNLESATIMDGVQRIGEYSFFNCKNLKDVSVPDSIISVGERGLPGTEDGNTGLYYCGKWLITSDRELKALEIREGTVGIAVAACSACLDTVELILPDSLRYIEAYAFAYCKSLREASLPKGLLRVGDAAFYDCDYLKKVYIPASVNEIGLYAFGYWMNSSGTSESLERVADFTIYGAPESQAERYALENELQFVPTGFGDVPENAFYTTAVNWALENGVTNGTDPTHFSPNVTCTRGQVVTFLWRAKGSPEPQAIIDEGRIATPVCAPARNDNTPGVPHGTGVPFVDISESAFYYKAVLWAVENEITAGMDATHFGPGEPCTRGQVVTFLWRTEGKPEPTTENNPFTDVTGGFYYKAVLWAVENKITAGMDATHFAPMNTCTRGQIVTFLYRDLAE